LYIFNINFEKVVKVYLKINLFSLFLFFFVNLIYGKNNLLDIVPSIGIVLRQKKTYPYLISIFQLGFVPTSK